MVFGRHALSDHWTQHPQAICPQCGSRLQYQGRNRVRYRLGQYVTKLARATSGRQPRWLAMLLERVRRHG